MAIAYRMKILESLLKPLKTRRDNQTSKPPTAQTFSMNVKYKEDRFVCISEGCLKEKRGWFSVGGFGMETSN